MGLIEECGFVWMCHQENATQGWPFSESKTNCFSPFSPVVIFKSKYFLLQSHKKSFCVGNKLLRYFKVWGIGG